MIYPPRQSSEMIARCYRFIAVDCVLLALTCLGGAFTLYLAIEAWLTGMPLTSAIETALAFFQWTLSDRTIGSIARHRKFIADLRELESRLERSQR